MKWRAGEIALAGVCLVYPFRLMLNAVAGVDLHLGLVCFALVGLLALATVRELPEGFPAAMDSAVVAYGLFLVLDLFLLTGPTAQALKGSSVELRFAVFYFVGRFFGLGRPFAIWLLGATLALGVLAAALGAVDYYFGWGTLLRTAGGVFDARFWKGGVPRLYSFAMSPLAAAYLMVLAVAAGIGLYAENRRRLWVAVAVIVLWQALPLTLARAALLAAVLLVASFVVADWRKGLRFAALSAAGVGVMVGATIARGWFRQQVAYVRKSTSLSDGSSVAHLSSFEKGLDLLAEHPFGVGLGQGGHVAMLRGGTYPFDDTYYMTLAVQVGWIGLALFVAILTLAAHTWWRELRDSTKTEHGLGLAGLGIFVSLAIGGLFVATWSMLVPQLYFWLLTAAAENLAAARRSATARSDVVRIR